MDSNIVFRQYVLVKLNRFNIFQYFTITIIRCIQHLSRNTKKTGIHVVLSTQRPSSNIISKEISEAIPHRISFYVMTGVDSKIAINRTGAQRLLGEGDMIYANINSEKGTHAQAALITDAEIDQIIKFCNSQISFGVD